MQTNIVPCNLNAIVGADELEVALSFNYLSSYLALSHCRQHAELLLSICLSVCL